MPMLNESIIVALIGAISTIIGVILTNRTMLEKQAAQMDKELAVYQTKTNEQIAELTREVREHNQVIKRMYSAEAHITDMDRRISEIEHRPS